MSSTTSGKIALVTGAGTGIGKHAALALSREGYSVALAGRRKDRLEETAAAAKGPTLVVPTDVGDPASVKALFAKTLEAFGRLDVLFNNAGHGGAAGAPRRPDVRAVEDRGRHQPDRGLSVHAGSLQDHEEPGPAGRAHHQQRLDLGPCPAAELVALHATKHGVSGLTKATSLDGRKYGIACGQIDIGNAATDMTARMTKGVPQANGTVAVEPTMDVRERGATRWPTWRACRWTPTCCS